MSLMEVYFGLGSNLGDRSGTLRAAVADIQAHPEFTFLNQAAVYATAPVGEHKGDTFLNTALCGLWHSEPDSLLNFCRQIENRFGRTRPYKDAPRTLDVDILWWSGPSGHHRDLEVPHPRLTERAFALVPLLELAPGLQLPETGQALSSFLRTGVLAQGIDAFDPVAAALRSAHA